MEPHTQYARTADAVSIGFWTLGEGLPLLLMPSMPFIPSRRAWEMPEGRRWLEGLAETHKLIRFDHRGFGDSQRSVVDVSLEAGVADLSAVVDHLKLETFVLLGYFASGPTAIAYAVRHPERLSHLILWCASVLAPDPSTSRDRALNELAQADFELYAEAFALEVFGWAEAEQARQYARALRESLTPETLQVFLGWQPDDVAELLPQVSTPTLVVHRRGLRAPSIDNARQVAARVPNARLATLEGESAAPYVGDLDAALGVINEFLGESKPAGPPAGGPVTILFTDITSSTPLTQRLGDEEAQQLVRAHNGIVREALQAHGGSEIKHTGDGIMASFPSASRAVECAVAIQRAVAAHVGEHPDRPLGVHIGLNAGEPVAEEHDLFGTAVQLARRICDHAADGEILASLVVRELVAGKGVLFADRGDTALRGFEDPARLYEVRWREET